MQKTSTKKIILALLVLTALLALAAFTIPGFFETVLRFFGVKTSYLL